jgi:hypothetical protein
MFLDLFSVFSSCAVFYEILAYNKYKASLIERFCTEIFFITTLAASSNDYYFIKGNQ